ncbi:hypothetical protein [Natribacillus halophilus]|uniref:Citrate transporter n=1 Tax=Natribacillus halophilus TaxID=549003 RepID=A0A1G8PBA7_9BACI|nr:hypothetical protein [Natribacillus halophilus]SDI89020.1 hypothetical protein SAMN04488123_10816 [Natribacillus halophilus]
MAFTHVFFLIVIATVFIFIFWRKNVVFPVILGTFLLAFFHYTDLAVLDRLISSAQAVFLAFMNAGIELFDIMLIITLMVAMLQALRAVGAAELMFSPLKKLMINPTMSFFVLGVTMYLASLFFWPTPAIALVGTVLIPIAVKAGLPAIGAAVAVNLFGHGMALSGDLVVQGAGNITAGAAGLDISEILPYTALFSLVVGFVAIPIAFFTIKRGMKKGKWKADEAALDIKTTDTYKGRPKISKTMAIFVPLVLLTIVGLMLYRAVFHPEAAIQGQDATALLGGTAVFLMMIATFVKGGVQGMSNIVEYIKEGFYFALKIFAPIIPLAGFFFLGHPDHAEAVLGEGAPGFLFDIGESLSQYIDGSPAMLVIGIVVIAILAGLDGSGFSGLPLVGGLSAALGQATGIDVAVLASLGQVVTIFVGGGTLAAWAFGAAADAGIAGVKPAELVRQNLVPVLIGVVVASIVAVWML